MALPTASDNAFPSLLITEGTIPASPAAGKQRQWIDSTTKQLKVVSSAGTQTVGSGLAFIGCIAYHTATQALTTATETVLSLNAEDVDSNAFHDTATNNSRITIAAGFGGKYLFIASTFIQENATGLRYVGFKKNGTTRVGNEVRIPASSGSIQVGIVLSTILILAAADYIEAVAYQSSGGNLNVGDATNRFVQTSLQCTFLGV